MINLQEIMERYPKPNHQAFVLQVLLRGFELQPNSSQFYGVAILSLIPSTCRLPDCITYNCTQTERQRKDTTPSIIQITLDISTVGMWSTQNKTAYSLSPLSGRVAAPAFGLHLIAENTSSITKLLDDEPFPTQSLFHGTQLTSRRTAAQTLLLLPQRWTSSRPSTRHIASVPAEAAD